jgi:hypothetical protein
MKLQQPDPYQVQAIAAILEQANFPVDHSIIEAVAAAQNAWLTSSIGREYMARFMQLAVTTARSEDEYFVEGELIPHTTIKLLYGYIVGGVAISPDKVRVRKRKVEECDVCNTYTICTQEVKTADGKYMMACSSCIKQSPDLVMKYKQENCAECTFSRCGHRGGKP